MLTLYVAGSSATNAAIKLHAFIRVPLTIIHSYLALLLHVMGSELIMGFLAFVGYKVYFWHKFLIDYVL